MNPLNDGLLVLYDCKLGFRSAAELGAKFFEQQGIKPNDMACRINEPEDSRSNGVKSVRSLTVFESWVDCPDLEYIVIAARDRGNPRAYMTFYYGHDRLHPDFHRLIVACDARQPTAFDLDGLVPLVAQAGTRTKVPYGFACHINLQDVSQYEYADAQALFVPFLPYEAPNLWKVEVPTYLTEVVSPRRYLCGMQRLVYEWNFLTGAHFAMPIDAMSLREWIAADASRGGLRELGEDLWAWHVQAAQLEQVNEACAQAGLLVAWKKPEPVRKPVRHLP